MSASEQVHIIAILYPRPDKIDRLEELMQPMIQKVRDSEPYTLRYIMTKQIDSESPAIHMIETYESKEGAEAHTRTEHFKALFAAFDEEDIFAKTPCLASTKSVQGFDLDHILI